MNNQNGLAVIRRDNTNSPPSPRNITETPRIAGSGFGASLKANAAPALLGGGVMAGMRIIGGESAPSALVGSGLTTAGGLVGQVAGEKAAGTVGRTAGKYLAKTAAGQAGKALAAKAAGTAIGSAIGSVIPGAGTLVGGALGGLVGSVAGDMLARKVMGGNQEPQIDPMSGEMMVDQHGQPITQTSYALDGANAVVPGMLTAQQMFDMAKQKNQAGGTPPVPSFGM